VTPARPATPTRTRKHRIAVTGLTTLALAASIAAASPAQAATERPASTLTVTSTTVVVGSPSAVKAKADAYARTHPLLRYGSKGSAVRKVQSYVGAKVNGHFGTSTRHKVRLIQKWGHVPATGIVNLKTWHVAYHYFATVQHKKAARLAPANIIKMARRYDGGPYRHGGTSPRGFDCSGFVQFVFARLGISLPRTAAQQYSYSHHISHRQLRAGDLLFFHHGSHVFHVAIYDGHGGVYHASHPGRATGYEHLWTSNFWAGRVR
jgi:peptidoglycan DL-endopeptidase CwlO